jgi:hypothetical protein
MKLPDMNSAAALTLYDLENYLFNDVAERFYNTPTGKEVTAFDFFCIVIWKANRSKLRIAKRLLLRGHDTLDAAVTQLIAEIRQAATDQERLQVMFEGWGFSLPMASALLTVFYPQQFTVYDARVCELLPEHAKLGNLSKFDKVWTGYEKFVAAVRDQVPDQPQLRNKDRVLWAMSFRQQLEADLQSAFGVVLHQGEAKP